MSDPRNPSYDPRQTDPRSISDDERIAAEQEAAKEVERQLSAEASLRRYANDLELFKKARERAAEWLQEDEARRRRIEETQAGRPPAAVTAAVEAGDREATRHRQIEMRENPDFRFDRPDPRHYRYDVRPQAISHISGSYAPSISALKEARQLGIDLERRIAADVEETRRQRVEERQREDEERRRREEEERVAEAKRLADERYRRAEEEARRRDDETRQRRADARAFAANAAARWRKADELAIRRIQAEGILRGESLQKVRDRIQAYHRQKVAERLQLGDADPRFPDPRHLAYDTRPRDESHLSGRYLPDTDARVAAAAMGIDADQRARGFDLSPARRVVDPRDIDAGRLLTVRTVTVDGAPVAVSAEWLATQGQAETARQIEAYDRERAIRELKLDGGASARDRLAQEFARFAELNPAAGGDEGRTVLAYNQLAGYRRQFELIGGDPKVVLQMDVTCREHARLIRSRDGKLNIHPQYAEDFIHDAGQGDGQPRPAPAAAKIVRHPDGRVAIHASIDSYRRAWASEEIDRDGGVDARHGLNQEWRRRIAPSIDNPPPNGSASAHDYNVTAEWRARAELLGGDRLQATRMLQADKHCHELSGRIDAGAKKFVARDFAAIQVESGRGTLVNDRDGSHLAARMGRLQPGPAQDREMVG